MTNTIAILIGLTVVGFLVYDNTWADGDTSLFLARKADQFIEWIAFWR